MARHEKPRQSTRRSFLSWSGIALGAAALAEALWVALSFLRPRPGRTEPGTTDIVEAGPVEAFPPGSVTAFPRGKFYLVHLDGAGFLALDRRCTHLGCTVPWDPGLEQFACPCHSSAFDARGQVLRPPAPRPLDRFEVRIENGIVKVDTSKPLRRSTFDPSQVRKVRS
jgi:cytochrome b6-f complex iron-sulfur subunit